MLGMLTYGITQKGYIDSVNDKRNTYFAWTILKNRLFKR